MTDAELAILSLLNDGIQADHALHAEIEARGLRRWTAIGVSSMYYILDKLVKQGLVDPIMDGKPERAWKITSAGSGVLQTAVADLLSTPHSAARGIELGLANLHVLRPSQIRTALHNYRHELINRLGRAAGELESERHGHDKFQTLAMYSHTVALLQAELDWIELTMTEYEALNLADPVQPIIEARPIPRIQQVVLPEDADSIHKETTMQHIPPERPKPRRKVSPAVPGSPADPTPASPAGNDAP